MRNGTARRSSSRTTARSSIAFARGSSSSTAACCARYPGNFAAYEARKAPELAAEATAARKFDKFWAQEEAWIRKGVEARRTRNEGRVRRLEQLRRERALRRERLGSVKLDARCGRALRQARRGARERRPSASATRDIVRDLSLRIMRGDRLA